MGVVILMNRKFKYLKALWVLSKTFGKPYWFRSRNAFGKDCEKLQKVVNDKFVINIRDGVRILSHLVYSCYNHPEGKALNGWNGEYGRRMKASRNQKRRRRYNYGKNSVRIRQSYGEFWRIRQKKIISKRHKLTVLKIVGPVPFQRKSIGGCWHRCKAIINTKISRASSSRSERTNV